MVPRKTIVYDDAKKHSVCIMLDECAIKYNIKFCWRFPIRIVLNTQMLFVITILLMSVCPETTGVN